MRLMAPPEYYYRSGFPGQYDQEPKQKNESIFNLINDKENLNRINKIANEGVNHIVAAFYIKSVQQSRQSKNQEGNTLQRRSSVPVSSVNLGDDKDQSTHSNDNINEIPQHTNMISNLNVASSPEGNSLQNGSGSPRYKANVDTSSNGQAGKYNFPNLNLNTNIFNDKCNTDIHEFTDNQLNLVNDVVKKLTEKKFPEIIDKDFTNMTLNTTSNFQSKNK